MPNKEPAAEGATADFISPREVHQTNRNISQDREARDVTFAKQVAKAVAREMAKAHVQYQAMINEIHAPVIPTTYFWCKWL